MNMDNLRKRLFERPSTEATFSAEDTESISSGGSDRKKQPTKIGSFFGSTKKIAPALKINKKAVIDESHRRAEAAQSSEDQRHDKLAGEMLRLVGSMRQQFTLAGTVIREDNASLDAMQQAVLDNRENLAREGKRLEWHAYRSCFDCALILMVVFVIWSFIATVLVMKFFPKRY